MSHFFLMVKTFLLKAFQAAKCESHVLTSVIEVTRGATQVVVSAQSETAKMIFLCCKQMEDIQKMLKFVQAMLLF